MGKEGLGRFIDHLIQEVDNSIVKEFVESELNKLLRVLESYLKL